MKQTSLNRGFTLIELLVVIAIIGLLSSVVLASLSSARQKSRDARRTADIGQIRIALEMYFDAAGYYPPIVDATSNETGSACGVGGAYTTAYGYTASYNYAGASIAGCGHCNRWCALGDLMEDVMPKLPKDPTNNTTYRYLYSSASENIAQVISDPGWGKWYGIMTVFEKSSANSQNDGGYFANAYEVGTSPTYCVNKYAGANGDWSFRNGAPVCDWGCVCKGGN